MKSTGPILAAGGITFANDWLFNDEKPDFRILLATGVAALGLGLLEFASPPLAEGIAWIALIGVLFTRMGGKPAPAENLLRITGF